MMTKRHPGNDIDGRWRMEDGGWISSLRLALFFPAALVLLLSATARADVKATVDAPAVVRGDPVTLTLRASGDDVSFPPLTEIAGYPIQSRGTSRNLSIINGHTTRTIEQRLVFTPTADVTIPALDVTVDGKVEHTLPIRVKVTAPQAAPKGAPVQMVMRLSKPSVYVGEPVELDLVFKYLPGTRIDDIKISEPTLEHFWIKRINDSAERSADSGGYITQTYRYLLFAQQSGDLPIPAIYAQIGTKAKTRRGSTFGDPFFNDPFFGGARMHYRKVYSAPAILHVSALPQGLEVYGDFTLHADVDKTAVDANKPLNLHIHIEGSGNVEDIPKFEPQIDHAIVYANDPEVKSSLKDGKYHGTFDQTIAVIPERDITIPPQAFTYFDSRTKKVNTLQTPPYFIKVTGAVPAPKSAAPVVESAAPAPADAAASAQQTGSRISMAEASGIFAAGIAVGALFAWIMGTRRRESRSEARPAPSMAKRIKAAKTDRELFELLLPYKGTDTHIDDTLNRLEANLYRNAGEPIDRKALAASFDPEKTTEITFV